MPTTTKNLLRRTLGTNTWLGRMLRFPRDFLLRDTVAEIRQEQKCLRKEISRLRRDLSRLREEATSLRKDVLVLRNDFAGLRNDVTLVQGDAKSLHKDVVLHVPERFNKNAANVRAMGTPAQTGTLLIKYMCERLSVADLGDLEVLDFGCGCRFADAIVNNRLPVKSYTGIDVDRELIEFLSASVADTRLTFYHWNARNPRYNPDGFPLAVDSSLPMGERTFDLICMFSVITHQLPEDAETLFRIFRRCVRPRGRMFFSANIQEMDDDYREMVSDKPTANSAYSAHFLRRLLERSGWRILSQEGKPNQQEMPIQDSLLCVPV